MEWTVIVLDSVPCVLYKTVCVEWTVVALCVVQDGVWSGQCILCVVQDSVCVEWTVTALCVVQDGEGYTADCGEHSGGGDAAVCAGQTATGAGRYHGQR